VLSFWLLSVFEPKSGNLQMVEQAIFWTRKKELRLVANRQAGGRSGERPRAARYELGDSLVSRRRE